MFKLVAISSFMLWTTLASADNLDLSGVAIERYEASGDCTTQQVSVTLSPDASYISILYDNLTLSANQSNQQLQKNCSVEVFFKKPKIKTIFGRIKTAYSVESVDYRGYLSLTHNSTASQEVKVENGYSDVGKVFINFANKQWNGPWEEDYFLRANYPVVASGYKYLGCLNADKDVARVRFKTKISLNHRNANGSSYFAVDSADATAQKLEHRFFIKWISVVDCVNALINSPVFQPQPTQPSQPTQPPQPPVNGANAFNYSRFEVVSIGAYKYKAFIAGQYKAPISGNFKVQLRLNNAPTIIAAAGMTQFGYFQLNSTFKAKPHDNLALEVVNVNGQIVAVSDYFVR